MSSEGEIRFSLLEMFIGMTFLAAMLAALQIPAPWVALVEWCLLLGMVAVVLKLKSRRRRRKRKKTIAELDRADAPDQSERPQDRSEPRDIWRG